MIRKDFLEVEGYFPGYAGLESSLVPTKEEYDDFRQRICKVLDVLESRIAAIEKSIDKSKEELIGGTNYINK